MAPAPGPTPRATIGVNVPIPGEQQATDWATSNGTFIALAIVVLVVGSFVLWLWRQQAVKILLGVVAGVFVGALLHKAGVL